MKFGGERSATCRGCAALSTRPLPKPRNLGRLRYFFRGDPMKIKLNSVMVDDQNKALKFYTEVLGFVLSKDIPMGEFKWLTVVSPEGPDDIELLLEPMGFPPARTFQKALFEAGIPATMFAVSDNEKAGCGVPFGADKNGTDDRRSV